jgi:phenylalanyl-tRNA synthetase beta chain
MRVPLSWLLEYAHLDLPTAPDGGVGEETAREVAARLTAVGLEVETIEPAGHDISGVVVAQVREIEELTGFKKPIRYCRVQAGDGQDRHVICGAVNFAVGDLVPLALPGSVLPGGFEIGARKAYGRMSEGMICSAAELGLGDDHSGILVLPEDAPLGQDFTAWAGLRDWVLDLSVTPDRGYALSIRGVARDLALAYDAAYTDPAGAGLPEDLAGESGAVWPASIGDPTACDRFVLREVRGLDPARPTPLALRVRLARCGMRSISLAVDVTNYLMIELGQPLHAFDRSALTGPVVVRRARPGEQLETLDHVVRSLDPDDILITDESGPISLAGTMGGLATEITPDSTDLVIEAAHFSMEGTARMSRRHRLFSEASARFERGVDRELPLRASARAVSLLSALGGGTVLPGCTHAQVAVEPATIGMTAGYPDQVAGVVYGLDAVTRRLRQVGCEVHAETAEASAPGGGPADPDGPGRHVRHEHARHDRTGGWLTVTPPSWRPDLTDPADLAEEVIRLEGYENVPVRMPRAAAGKGLTPRQRLRRALGRHLASRGYVEVISNPFAPAADAGLLGLPPGDPRRSVPQIANPIKEDEPLMRGTLLPGLLRVLIRNTGRGFADVALFELGKVFLTQPGGPGEAPILAVDHGPTVAEAATLDAALPGQPLHLGVVLAGNKDAAGWWGQGRPACWEDAIEAARQALAVYGVPFTVTAAQEPPWHPGRCAALSVTAGPGRSWLVGYAGELHPRVISEFGLPPRACAAELDMSVVETALAALGPVQVPPVSGYPVATQDVSLSVPAGVPSAEVAAALVDGARAEGGSLLEDIVLFDVYTGEQAGEGRKSLSYTLRFRAADRTLTAEEASAAREAAVAEAARRTGAVLRGA